MYSRMSVLDQASAANLDDRDARIRQLESLLKLSELRYAKLDYKYQDLLRRIYGPKNESLNEAQRQLFGILDQGEVCESDRAVAKQRRRREFRQQEERRWPKA